MWQQPSASGNGNDGTGDYVLLRRWASDQARLQTHEDPDAHRLWARMGLIMETILVYERLEEVGGA